MLGLELRNEKLIYCVARICRVCVRVFFSELVEDGATVGLVFCL